MYNVHRVDIEAVLDELEDADMVANLLTLLMNGFELFGEYREDSYLWYGLTCKEPHIITSWEDSWFLAVLELLDALGVER